MARMGIFWVIVMVVSVFKSERLLSRTDSLTRIANRQAFFEQATLEIERCRRYGRALSVAYLDCDDFKKVNDQRGHLAGDALLRSVADCLKNNVRGADLVARLGGDEFALLLPETGIAAARGVLEKVQVLLQMTLETGGWPTSFSIGSVTFLEPPRSVDQMIQRADELMYEVKRSGKNGVRLQVIGSSRTDPQPLIGSSTRSRL
jgi:diguanylate cyclase (GGDEF)-like protein